MKRIMLLVVIIVLGALSAWAQFYEKLSDSERRDLAEAYYLVSRQYAEQGVKDKAGDFEQMAFNIYPDLDLSAIQVADQPSAAALILAGRAKLAEAPRERAEATEQLLKSRFLRLVSSFLTEDAETMLELMDGSVWFAKLDRELTQDEMSDELSAFFARVNLAGGLAPSQVYDLATLEVRPLEGGAPAWGEAYAVRVDARMDFSAQVAFWEASQQYLFHRTDGRWLLFAVGGRLPPASWEPRAASEPAPRGEAGEPQAGPGREIREAFLASLSFFLQKDTEQASQYFTREVRILRLNASLSREEMASTFEGYFEGSDFSGVEAESVVDTGSIAVEPSERFAGEREGQVYLLSVKTRMDLSDAIPFWTRFQEYYFSSEEGGWKIFAIF